MASRTRRVQQRHRSEPDPLARMVGARVRRLRQQQDFSFDAFVEEVGLGRGYVSELERGLVVPTITSLARIATALEVTLADLVLGESPREQLFDELRALDEGMSLRLLQQVRSPTSSPPEKAKAAPVRSASGTKLKRTSR